MEERTRTNFEFNEYESKFITDMSYPTFVNNETRKADLAKLKEIAGNIDIMVNNFSIHHKEIASALNEDIMSKASGIILALEWIRFWAVQPPYMFDGRNQYSGEICRKLYEDDKFNETYDIYCSGNTTASAFATMIEEYLVRMHKTLMQTFTRTLFTFLNICKDSDVKELVANVQADNDRWYAMPLI